MKPRLASVKSCLSLNGRLALTASLALMVLSVAGLVSTRAKAVPGGRHKAAIIRINRRLVGALAAVIDLTP
ncbi:hypothetical protein D3C75_1316430 [compost metagenome]